MAPLWNLICEFTNKSTSLLPYIALNLVVFLGMVPALILTAFVREEFCPLCCLLYTWISYTGMVCMFVGALRYADDLILLASCPSFGAFKHNTCQTRSGIGCTLEPWNSKPCRHHLWRTVKCAVTKTSYTLGQNTTTGIPISIPISLLFLSWHGFTVKSHTRNTHTMHSLPAVFIVW